MTTVSQQPESGTGTNRGGKRVFAGFERIWEMLLIATVAPAVFYGIQSLNSLPIA